MTDYTKELWYNEAFYLRFVVLKELILVNDFGLLTQERREIWLAWLAPKYPKHRVILV